MKWVDRKFAFDFPAHIYPELMDQLRSTPTKARKLTTNLAAETLTRRHQGTWSIQENIAHLADLDEETFGPRLDQFDANAEELKPADKTNRATEDANHNDRSIEEVLSRFEKTRWTLVARLEAKDPAYFDRAARHPRLDRPMRVVDLLYFKAEHDRHHLGRIRQLLAEAKQ
jgi:uncharacterized damage-inducible protein DinB